jgi:membrane associated rhomboid family serine protease
MKISYNSPVILTFTVISALAMLLGDLTQGKTTLMYFTTSPEFNFREPVCYLRLVTHMAGHFDWPHFTGNFAFILLIGPMIEEKYGSMRLLWLMLITGVMTGIMNTFFFSTALMGASGIVFMLITLGSFANIKTGEIPMTFILVVVLFLSKEMVNAMTEDNISQFAHIVGGICGGAFGFMFRGK